MTQPRASMGNVILDYPGDLLAAAGRVSLAHGRLELMLRMTIKTLTGLSVRDALDATSNSKTWELRIDIGKRFRQKTKNVALQYRMKSLLGRCEQLSERRNKLLHNTWAIGSDGSVVTKGEAHAWGKAPTTNDLNRLASEIKDCVGLLNEARLRGYIREVCEAHELMAPTESTPAAGVGPEAHTVSWWWQRMRLRENEQVGSLTHFIIENHRRMKNLLQLTLALATRL